MATWFAGILLLLQQLPVRTQGNIGDVQENMQPGIGEGKSENYQTLGN